MHRATMKPTMLALTSALLTGWGGAATRPEGKAAADKPAAGNPPVNEPPAAQPPGPTRTGTTPTSAATRRATA